MGYRALMGVTRWAVLALLLAAAFTTTTAAAAPVAATPTDMAVTVSDSPDPVTAGQDLTYTIVVTNNGPSDADATVADTLPAGATFSSLDQTAAFTCTTPPVGAGGTVSCSKANLPSGASATFTLSVHVSSGVPDGSALSDTATVSTVPPLRPSPTPMIRNAAST